MEFKARELTIHEIELAMQLLYMGREPMMVLDEDVRSIGELLRIKRVADNFSLKELAKQFRITPGTLSEIERGIRTIPRGKEKVIDDYIFKTLYLNGGLEYQMNDDEEEDYTYE